MFRLAEAVPEVRWKTLFAERAQEGGGLQRRQTAVSGGDVMDQFCHLESIFEVIGEERDAVIEHGVRGRCLGLPPLNQKSYPIQKSICGLRKTVLPPWSAKTTSSHFELKSVRHDQSRWAGKPSRNVCRPMP